VLVTRESTRINRMLLEAPRETHAVVVGAQSQVVRNPPVDQVQPRLLLGVEIALEGPRFVAPEADSFVPGVPLQTLTGLVATASRVVL